MNRIRHQQLGRAVPIGQPHMVAAVALGVMMSFLIRAQDITIPDEFLSGEPSPLGLGSVLNNQSLADEDERLARDPWTALRN